MSLLNQVILTITLQTAFFCLYFLLGFRVSRLIRRRVCPVCFAVGSTWLTMITLRAVGAIEVNRYLISILLSQSVVGVSYLTEEFQLVYGTHFEDYLLKFGIILYGTLSVAIFAFFNEPAGFAMFLPIIIFGFFSLTPNAKPLNLQKGTQ